MSGIEIKSLYTRNRVSDDGVKILCLLLYLPLGVVLLILRIFLGLQVLLLSYILPDSPISQNVLSKLASMSLGISINVENPKDKEDVKVYITNQVSILDHFIVHIATESVTPTGDIQVNPLLASILGIYNYGTVANLDDVKKNVIMYMSTKTSPLHFQPEGIYTNGQGLLKFKTWPFSFTPQVQPIAVEVTRPFLDISVTTIDSSYWKDLFFYLFSPCTTYKIRYLSAAEKKDLSDTAFAERIRQEIAASLKIEASPHSAADVVEWKKRDHLERIRRMSARPSAQSSMNVHPEVTIMANQVKEVLPLVPYNVIVRDLVKTRSVDITISNILEGHVAYTPEPEPKPIVQSSSPSRNPSSSGSPSTSATSSSSPRVDSLCTAASSFPKSAQERMLSFQERKAQLIQTARKKYIEKHGLNIVALNNC